MNLKQRANGAIQRLLELEGLSRSDLARLLKVSRPTVTIMLRPGQNLTLDTLETVVRKLGYEIEIVCKKR